jgi:ribosomal protein S27E
MFVARKEGPMKRFLVAALCMAGAAPVWADEFYHDFRKGPLPANIEWFQANKENVARLEPEGLRITLPRDWMHPYGGVGVSTTFGIQGDCEITTTYEILEAEEPPMGSYGVGVSLRVHYGPKELSNLSRVVRAGGRQIVLWNRAIEVDGKQKFPEDRVDCTDRIGRLRMKRVGTMLHYLRAAGEAGEEFQEAGKVEIGANEIRRVQLVGINGRQPVSADVRFIDLRIRSDGPLPAPGEAPAGAAASGLPSPRILWWGLTAVLIALAMALPVVLRRRRVDATTTEAADPAEPAASGEMLEVQCPGCHKRLKVAAASAGKKVKCPGCAAAFVAR